MIFLSSPFSEAWAGKDPFEEIKKIEGVVYRHVLNRSTTRFEFCGQVYYIKVHTGSSLREILKNLVCLKLPVLGAGNEYRAILKLHELNVNTMDVVAFGERGYSPFKRKSFIITKELTPTMDLRAYCLNWRLQPPSFEHKRAIIATVADMLRRMHSGGVNHRDCYLVHFLVDLTVKDPLKPRLFLIDLHRAQIRRTTPKRWRNKDLVELYYSSKRVGFSLKDYFYFLMKYKRSDSLRDVLMEERHLISGLERKSERIAKRSAKKHL